MKLFELLFSPKSSRRKGEWKGRERGGGGREMRKEEVWKGRRKERLTMKIVTESDISKFHRSGFLL